MGRPMHSVVLDDCQGQIVTQSTLLRFFSQTEPPESRASPLPQGTWSPRASINPDNPAQYDQAFAVTQPKPVAWRPGRPTRPPPAACRGR